MQDNTQPQINTPTPQPTPQAPIQDGTQQQLDPTVVNMARAIKSVETGGSSNPYQATGASGEYGAYQYEPDTWAADSQKYLGQEVPLQEATIAQQNEVAYKKIADLKAQGYNPSQVASIWNSGKPDPTGNVGTKSKGVNYNTPQYVDQVVKSYNAYKSGQTPNPSATASTVGGNTQASTQDSGQDQGLGSELAGRLGTASGALSDLESHLQGQGGSKNPISDVLDVGGAIGGGIGDVINAGIGLIPGVKQGEAWLGSQLGKLANTQGGQAVMGAYQSWAQSHPELAQDAGDVFNIATAFPILRGLGAVGDIAKFGVAQTLKSAAEKGALNDLSADMTRIPTLSKVFANNGGQSTIKAGIAERLIPDIQDGKYITKDVINETSGKISDIDQNELQPILDAVSKKQNIGQSLSTLEKKAIAAAKDDQDLKEAGVVPQAIAQIQKRFAGWKYSYGDNVDLSTENRLKIGSGKFSDWGTPEGSADKAIYSAIQKDIEGMADKHNLPSIKEINGRMGTLIKYRNMMSKLDGRKVKVSLGSKIARKAVAGAVGIAANKLGGGTIGGLVSGLLTNTADRGIENLPNSIRRAILERTGAGAVKPSLKRTGIRTAGLLSALTAQRQANGG